MICQHCQAETPDNSNFCTACGTPLNAPPMHYRLDLGKLFGDTFELYKRHFGTLCLVGLILFVIPGAFNMLGQMSSVAMQITARQQGQFAFITMFFLGLQVLMMVLQVIAQWYVTFGSIRQCLYLARGGAGFQANQMFPTGMSFLNYAGFMLLVCCITLPLILPGMITYFAAIFVGVVHKDVAIGMLPLFAVGVLLSLACFCVAVWIWIRLFLAQMFIADREAAIIDSLKDAWRVSSGNFWMLFLATFVLMIASMLGFFLCCVGMILTIAIMSLGGVLAYLQLTGQPNGLDASRVDTPNV